MKLFQKICKMKQSQLKRWLSKRYQDSEYIIHNENGFLYLEPKVNAVPICLVAHMDTVHKEQPREFVIEKHPNQTVLSSPQGIGGDDRCGIYMIVSLLDAGYRPHVIFVEDEEIGCVGARLFAGSTYPSKMEINFIVELDRRGSNDAVYYDCDVPEFEEFITQTTGFKTAEGSFTDICKIAPEVGVAAVNLSCGYYKEHSLEHYVVWEEMQNTLLQVIKLLTIESIKFKYVEHTGYSNSYIYGSYVVGTFTWIDAGELKVDYVDGYSENEVIGDFMLSHPNLCLNDVSYDIEYY